MKTHKISIVDVFNTKALTGNPLAVVHNADELSNSQMQKIAAWLNFSETSFLMKPSCEEADYKLKIFTPTNELSFAGHPTIGSCAVWLQSIDNSFDKKIVKQQCGIGIVRISNAGNCISFESPPLKANGATNSDDLNIVTKALGLTSRQVADTRLLDNGTPWLVIQVTDVAILRNLVPNHHELRNYAVGVFARPSAVQNSIELRSFVNLHGISEDPATGSLNAAMAYWLFDDLFKNEDFYTIKQGLSLGKDCEILAKRANGQHWIGGSSALIVHGEINIEGVQ